MTYKRALRKNKKELKKIEACLNLIIENFGEATIKDLMNLCGFYADIYAKPKYVTYGWSSPVIIKRHIFGIITITKHEKLKGDTHYEI